MVREGADLIDIGAESTRPGSAPVSEEHQIARLIPVLDALRDLPTLLSVDTTRAAVAEVAIDHGVRIVNDISAGRDDPGMFPLVARRGVPIILMHMQGTPATMQLNPAYDDVVTEVYDFLQQRTHAAETAGIAPHRILLDVGFGFGKTLEHNLQLLRQIKRFTALARPLVVGTSRKGFLGKLINEPDPQKRTYATAATIAWAVTNGAGILRVHDVSPMSQVVQIITSLMKKP